MVSRHCRHCVLSVSSVCSSDCLSPPSALLRSNYGPTMTQKVHAFLAARGIPLASNQINFSLMYRKAVLETVEVRSHSYP